jgi:DNA-binding PadR family transcriptional regulator
MTKEKQDGPGYESIILAYIGQHPDTTKYELAKKIRTHAHLNGIPYSTLSLWIKTMVERQEVTATKLGPTRVGLQKTGYRITPGALHWIADALETQELMALVRQHQKSLPISASLIERAIGSTGDASRVLQAVTDLKIPKKKGTFDDYFGNLLLSILWDLEFDDPAVQREFVGSVIRAAAEANADVMERKDFASSMSSIIEEESRFLANATSTLAIVKDAAEKLKRS